MQKKIFNFSKWHIEEDIIEDIDHHIEDLDAIEDIEKFDKKKSFIFSKWRTKSLQEEVIKR